MKITVQVFTTEIEPCSGDMTSHEFYIYIVTLGNISASLSLITII